MARLKLFGICLLKDVLVLVPKPLGSAFFYSDLHLDTNYLRTFVKSNSVKKLIIDFKDVNYFGSELMETIDMVKQECMRQGGEVVLCRLSQQSERVRVSLSLFHGAMILASLADAMSHFGVSSQDINSSQESQNSKPDNTSNKPESGQKAESPNEDSGMKHSPN